MPSKTNKDASATEPGLAPVPVIEGDRVVAIERKDTDARVTTVGDSRLYMERVHKVPELARLVAKGLKVIQDVEGGYRFIFRRDVTLPCGHSVAPRIACTMQEFDRTNLRALADQVEIQVDAEFAATVCNRCTVRA